MGFVTSSVHNHTSHENKGLLHEPIFISVILYANQQRQTQEAHFMMRVRLRSVVKMYRLHGHEQQTYLSRSHTGKKLPYLAKDNPDV